MTGVDIVRSGSLATTPDLDRWVTVSPDGVIVVRTGKAELGQGIRTAISAIAADELGVDVKQIRVEGPATGRSPNEWVTAGSASIETSGSAVRKACAHARRILTARAADVLGVAQDSVAVVDGTVVASDGRSLSYWELPLVPFGCEVDEGVPPIAATDRRWTGHPLRRVDLPAKLRGEAVYVHDMRLPGMRFARVLRPPRPGAEVVGNVPDAGDAVTVVRDANFVAVVADLERDAVSASRALAPRITWEGGAASAPDADSGDYLRSHVVRSCAVVDGLEVEGAGRAPDADDNAGLLRATYTKPFIMHAAIGPSAAVAHYDGVRLFVWSHSQGVESLRLALAAALGLDATNVAVTHVDGAGCYGHNGADDAAMDASLIALALPGRPVLLQWSRADEHRWEPLGSAMSVSLEAELSPEGHITAWRTDVYTYPHVARPGNDPAGTSALLATWSLDPPAAPVSRRSPGFHAGGHRNADPLYDVGQRCITKHLVGGQPPRTSSTRSLGAFANVFAIESFMDELAAEAGADPVEFRLAHLADPRARTVIGAAVDLAGGLQAPGALDAPGRGLAFARYENCKAYAAVVAEVNVDARTGLSTVAKAWIAADAGEVVDPDGLVNQLEGGFIQAASWTLKERVAFDADGVTTSDWESYPILRFSEVPEVTTRLVMGPGPSLGAGEAATGPAAASIANAVAQATGLRFRDLPLTPERVRSAMAEALGD